MRYGIAAGLRRAVWAWCVPIWCVGAFLEVEVTGSRVNLRTSPVEDAEVAGQVKQGARLMARAVHEEWVEVVPPSELNFWVHADFLVDGRVQPETLNVRSGPGIAHQRVGQVRRGDVLDVRGQFADWIKIAPLAGSSLWISRAYVRPVAAPPLDSGPEREAPDVPSAPVEVVTPEPEQAADSAPPSPLVLPAPAESLPVIIPARLPPAPSDLRMNPDTEQGRVTGVKGELARVGFLLRRPARYRVVERDMGRTRTLAYIRGDESRLEALIGRDVHIRGRTYVLRSHRYPVVLGDQITLFP